jgi:hypothetical protein
MHSLSRNATVISVCVWLMLMLVPSVYTFTPSDKCEYLQTAGGGGGGTGGGSCCDLCVYARRLARLRLDVSSRITVDLCNNDVSLSMIRIASVVSLY